MCVCVRRRRSASYSVSVLRQVGAEEWPVWTAAVSDVSSSSAEADGASGGVMRRTASSPSQTGTGTEWVVVIIATIGGCFIALSDEKNPRGSREYSKDMMKLHQWCVQVQKFRTQHHHGIPAALHQVSDGRPVLMTTWSCMRSWELLNKKHCW